MTAILYVWREERREHRNREVARLGSDGELSSDVSTRERLRVIWHDYICILHKFAMSEYELISTPGRIRTKTQGYYEMNNFVVVLRN